MTGKGTDAYELRGSSSLRDELTRVEDERRRLLAAERAARAELEGLFLEAPGLLAVLRGPEHVFARANPTFQRLAGGREILGRPAREVFPEVGDDYFELLDRVYATSEPVFLSQALVALDRTGNGTPEDVWFDFSYQPLRGEDGAVTGIYVNAVEVTEHVRERLRIDEERRRHEEVLDASHIGEWKLDLRTSSSMRSRRHDVIFGYEDALDDWSYERFLEHVHADDRDRVAHHLQDTLATGVDWDFECRISRRDGELRWIWAHGTVHEWEDDRPAQLLGFVVDITERKREADALRETEQRFRVLVESSTSIVWTTDAAGAIDAPSASWESFTGQRPEEYVGDEWGWLEAVHPDDRPGTRSLWAEAVAGDEPVRAEYRLRRADGEYRRVAVSAAPLTGADGVVSGWIGSNTDVEDARRARDEIEKFVRVVEASGDLVGMASLDGATIYLNPSGLALLGLESLDEAVGVPIEEFCTPETRERLVAEVLPRVLAGETVQLDWTLRHHGSGEPIETEAIVFVVTDTATGSPLAIASVQRDVRERRQREAERARLLAEADAARREAERRAHATAAFTFVSDGVVLVDGDGLLRSWNPAAARLVGLGDGSGGRRLGEVVEGWSSIADRIPLAQSGASEPAGPDTLPLEQGGRERWLTISGTVFDGGTVYTFRDVTADRALDRIRSNLISTISHELRTPLAAVYGAAMTLQRADLELDRVGRVPFLEMIESNAQRLSSIVDEILLAGKLEDGTLPVAIEPVDAVELARRAIADHFVEGRELLLDAPASTAPAAADPERLRQVLGNLIDNAVKYSGADAPVIVRVEEREDAVRLSVADGGPGIPAHELGRIFDKFYRVDADMHDGVRGTGLGLYICRELVGNMKGRIWAESEPGSGSTFHVELPLAGR